MTALLISGRGAASPVTAQAPASSQLRLLSSEEGAIVLELTVADFQLEAVEHAGQTYHRVIILPMVQTATPGAPQVPTRGTLLGLPSIAEVSVQVLDAEYETLSGYRLPPAPQLVLTTDNLDNLLAGGAQQTLVFNQDLYASDAFYPGAPVAIGYTGYMRHQPVAQVQFYPVQYNPLRGEVRLYRRVLAQITWESPLSVATAGARWASPAYENLLRNTLLNYTALERPPVAEVAPLVDASGTEVAAASSPTATLKIGVTKDGLYKLTYSNLTGAGLDPSSIDPRTIKVSNRGTEIPIYVQGESDGVFDPTDYILFYGSAITDIYTTRNVYWLTAGGSNGQRMSLRNGTLSGSAPLPAHFPVTLHAEKDKYYWQTMPNGEGQDHWFWGSKLSAPELRYYSLSLRNISATTGTATVRVRLKGCTDTSINPDHHTRIYLNGIKIDDQLWDGFSIYDHQASVSHSYLNEGSNTIRVEAVGDTGAPVDQLFVNWIEIDYWDTYVAENDELFFGAPAAGTFQYEVTGFSSNDVQVFDVTDPADVAIITDTITLADGIQFEDTAQPETRYLALTPAQRKSPASIEADQPSSWRSTSHGADYIIITHEDFYTSSLTLAGQRSITSGLRVATVKVEDIYDEFNHGIFNPQAIRDFLSYAYHNWVAPAPIFVLLVGDASYDYRDLLSLNRTNYVSTQMIETDLLGQTPSDNWFVLVSGDDILPDMFIGRLTAQNISEAERMVDKIIHYEQNPPDASWNTKVLLVADDREPSFETISEQIADLLPHYYTTNKVYADDYPPGDPTIDIANSINDGDIMVNYVGHGSVNRWGTWEGGRIFLRSDITALRNTHKLPVVTVANCLNGYFVGKNVSMAEEFLRRNHRGAVAVWAATGMGYSSGHRVLLREFYEAVFQDNAYALGAATTAAKIATYAQSSFWGELVETFVLFGDPATQLGIPTNYPYVESITPTDGADDVPVDQDLQIVFSKPMDAATVVLGGEGATGLVFTPTWSAGNTVVDYAHTDFGYGQALTFTISGQDKLGNPLGPGLVPRTWSFVTMPANSMETVAISGPTTGVVQVDYTFDAAVSPITATLPITYVWQATDQAPATHTDGALNDTATFTWSTPGSKTITVTVTNAVGTATNTHVVTLDYAPPTGVDITGPTTGVVEADYTFNATVSPITATQPITYVWQATGQAPVTHTGGGSNDTVTFSWNTFGPQVITVTATNAGGTVTQTHQVTISSIGVDIAGSTTGTVNTAYPFNAIVSPITAAQPITYVWQATGQAPVTHTGGGLSNTVAFNWSAPGIQAITATATNAVGTAANTHLITINAPPSSADIASPTTGTVNIACIFTATVSPITATQPITYVWQATGQAPVMHTGSSLSDTVAFNWSAPGIQAITATATNAGGTVTGTHLVTINDVPQDPETKSIYLPLVIINN